MSGRDEVKNLTANDQIYNELKTPDFLQGLWARHHHSARGENPFEAAARAVMEHGAENRDAAFLITVFRKLDGALSTTALEDATRGAQIGNVIKAIEREYPGVKTIRGKHLTEDQQKFLNMIDGELAAVKIHPLADATLDLFQKALSILWHLVVDASKHKVMTSVLLTGTLAAAWVMNNNGLTQSTIYVPPEALQITETVDIDSIMSDKPFTIDPSIKPKPVERSCHDHIAAITTPEIADFARKYLPVPLHCTGTMDRLEKAQQGLKSSYSFMNQSTAWMTQRPKDISAVLPQSHFTKTFDAAADWHAKKTYAFDAVENIIIHLGLLFLAARTAHEVMTVKTDQAREGMEEISDFIRRTIKTHPLGYGLMTGGAAAAYAAGAGMNIGMIWGGFAGLLAGNTIHNLGRSFRRAATARAMIGDMAAGIKLDAGALPDEGEFRRVLAAKKQKLIRAGITTGFVASAAGLGALINADANGTIAALSPGPIKNALNMAVDASANISAATMVWGSYVTINLPQDSVAHVIFGIAGGIGGTLTGVGHRAIEWTWDKIRAPWRGDKMQKLNLAGYRPLNDPPAASPNTPDVS